MHDVDSKYILLYLDQLYLWMTSTVHTVSCDQAKSYAYLPWSKKSIVGSTLDHWSKYQWIMLFCLANGSIPTFRFNLAGHSQQMWLLFVPINLFTSHPKLTSLHPPTSFSQRRDLPWISTNVGILSCIRHKHLLLLRLNKAAQLGERNPKVGNKVRDSPWSVW